MCLPSLPLAKYVSSCQAQKDSRELTTRMSTRAPRCEAMRLLQMLFTSFQKPRRIPLIGLGIYLWIEVRFVEKINLESLSTIVKPEEGQWYFNTHRKPVFRYDLARVANWEIGIAQILSDGGCRDLEANCLFEAKL